MPARIRIISFLRKVFSLPDTGTHRAELTDSINRINLARAKFTAFVFLLLESFLLILTLLVKRDGAFRSPTLYYLGMYVLMLLAMAAFTALFGAMEKDLPGHRRKIGFAGVVFTGFILCWCAGISLMDQLHSGGIMVYTVAVVAISAVPIFPPVTFLFLFWGVQAAFATLTVLLLPSSFSFANIVNSFCFVAISWAVSFMRYKAHVATFRNERLIEEKNAELKRINEKLQRVNRSLDRMSRTDGLTGVCNRYMFDFMIKLEWNRCRRQFVPLSLIMIDVDFFKRYNDRYGHRAGDLCLRKIAAVLSSCARRSFDTVARYGGEEFAVILPRLDSGSAQSVAEQIRTEVERLALPHAGSAISAYVTISLGVCTVIPGSDSSTIDTLIERADQALYDAKKSRNMVSTSALSGESKRTVADAKSQNRAMG